MIAGKTVRILVVDDEEPLLRLMGTILESEGYSAILAANSDQALDISAACRDEIELLITDVKMDPSMTGYQLAQCLRLMRVEIKVLYISGYVEDEMVRWETETGAAGFMQKPFTPEALLSKVQAMLAYTPR